MRHRSFGAGTVVATCASGCWAAVFRGSWGRRRLCSLKDVVVPGTNLLALQLEAVLGTGGVGVRIVILVLILALTGSGAQWLLYATQSQTPHKIQVVGLFVAVVGDGLILFQLLVVLCAVLLLEYFGRRSRRVLRGTAAVTVGVAVAVLRAAINIVRRKEALRRGVLVRVAMVGLYMRLMLVWFGVIVWVVMVVVVMLPMRPAIIIR